MILVTFERMPAVLRPEVTKDKLISNLGTIAKFGAKASTEATAGGGDDSMSGQFGVGCYSTCLGSDKVRVLSQDNFDERYKRESEAGCPLTMKSDARAPRGGCIRARRRTQTSCISVSECAAFLRPHAAQGECRTKPPSEHPSCH